MQTKKKIKIGWSLTLAGTYRDDMAPDVEMRLSFPKKSPKDDETEQHQRQRTIVEHPKFSNGLPPHHQRLNNNFENPSLKKAGFHRQQSDVSNENYQQHSGRGIRPTLPMPAHLNPKRTLSKSIPGMHFNAIVPRVYDLCIEQFPILTLTLCSILLLVARLQNTTNMNRNTYTLPEVNTFDHEVARQTARKTIKVFNRINFLLC